MSINGVVQYRKDGRMAYYRIGKDGVDALRGETCEDCHASRETAYAISVTGFYGLSIHVCNVTEMLESDERAYP